MAATAHSIPRYSFRTRWRSARPAVVCRVCVTASTSSSRPLLTSAAASWGQYTASRSANMQLSTAASGARRRLCTEMHGGATCVTSKVCTVGAWCQCVCRAAAVHGSPSNVSVIGICATCAHLHLAAQRVNECLPGRRITAKRHSLQSIRLHQALHRPAHERSISVRCLAG